MLNIQKIVLSLDELKYHAFKEYLASNKYNLSLSLIEALKGHGLEEASSEELTQQIYGQDTEKDRKKFFQLAHFTFRLTRFIARNFPFYLAGNLNRIEEFVHKNEHEKADVLADITLELAIKIEDYSTAISVLKYVANRSYYLEKRKESQRLHQQIKTYLEIEDTVNNLYLYIRKHLNFKDKKNFSKADADHHLSYFKPYCKHPSKTVEIIAQHGMSYCLSFLNDARFYESENIERLGHLSKEIEKHSYLLLPFGNDILLNIEYLQIKAILHKSSQEELQKESLKLLEKWKDFRFWKDFANAPLSVALSIQASYYVSKYNHPYQKGFYNSLPVEVRNQLSYFISLCEDEINTVNWDQGMYVHYINFNILYSGFLVLRSREDCKKAIKIIESLLINYQQIPFQKIYDTLFAILILAHFSLGNYFQVHECFKRYEKLTSGNKRNLENELSIKAYYYTTQWLDSKRPQYVKKLKQTMELAEKKLSNTQTPSLIKQLISYFEIPVN